MESESENNARISHEDTIRISFLPIWIYHSICHAGLDSARFDKRSMIVALESNSEGEYLGAVGFMLGYLKFNIHKLFEHHYGNLLEPDFSRLESDLVHALDLLQTAAIEQPVLEPFREYLRWFAARIGENPRIRGELSERERDCLRGRASLIQRMIP